MKLYLHVILIVLGVVTPTYAQAEPFVIDYKYKVDSPITVYKALQEKQRAAKGAMAIGSFANSVIEYYALSSPAQLARNLERTDKELPDTWEDL